MSFVIRRKADGQYAKGKPIHEWHEDLQRARVFVTKTTAINALPRLAWSQRIKPEEVEILPVVLALG